MENWLIFQINNNWINFIAAVRFQIRQMMRDRLTSDHTFPFVQCCLIDFPDDLVFQIRSTWFFSSVLLFFFSSTIFFFDFLIFRLFFLFAEINFKTTKDWEKRRRKDDKKKAFPLIIPLAHKQINRMVYRNLKPEYWSIMASFCIYIFLCIYVEMLCFFAL